MGYFVSEQEFIDKKKDIGTAGACILFLGIFGAHRFYLGRYLSGSIILAALLLTAGQALWVIIPFVIIEIFQLSLVNDRIDKQKKHEIYSKNFIKTNEKRNNSTVRTVIIHHQLQQVATNFVPRSPLEIPPASIPAVSTKSDDVIIYDISSVETFNINSHKQFEPKPQIHRGWTRRLVLPYDRPDLAIPQLQEMIYTVFEKLADYLDQELQKEGSSLNALLGRITMGKYSHDNNFLYTIFCIAEGEVTQHYSRGRLEYDNSFFYKLIKGRMSDVHAKHLEKYAQELIKSLPLADATTKSHFNITNSNITNNRVPIVNVELAGLSDSTLELLRVENSTPWINDVLHVQDALLEDVIILLNKYSQVGTINKLAKNILRKRDDIQTMLLAIYQVAVIDGKLDEQLDQKLRKVIPAAQYSDFFELATKKKKLSTSLASELEALLAPYRKQVILDDKKLASANEESEHAISSVMNYLGENENENEIFIPIVDNKPLIIKELLFVSGGEEVVLQDDQKEFMRQIIGANNNLDVAEATLFAKNHKKMLNGYVQTVNKALFDKFEDQVIIQQDNKIKIEDDYVVLVKELL